MKNTTASLPAVPSVESLQKEIASLTQQVKELEHSKEIFSSLIENSPGYLVIVSPDGTIRYIKPGLSDTGVPLQSILGQNAFDFLTPESKKNARNCLSKVLCAKTPSSYESTGIDPSGDLYHYDTKVIPFPFEGDPDTLLLVSSNITSYKQKEIELREIQEKLQVAVSASGMGLWSWDIEQDHIVWTEPLCELFACTKEEAPHNYMEFIEWVFPEDRHLFQLTESDWENLPASSTTEYRVKRKDGQIRWVLSKGSMFFNPKTKTTRYLGGTIDITDQKLAQQKLRESERKYRSIFESTAVAIWEGDVSATRAELDSLAVKGITDINAYIAKHPEFVQNAISKIQVLNVNAHSVVLFEAESKQHLLKWLQNIFVPENFAFFRAGLRAIFENQRDFSAEATIRTLQNQTRNVLIKISLPVEAEQHSNPLLVSLIDITQQKQVETKLAQHLSQEQEGRWRASFLAETSKVLASSLDYMTTLETVAHLTVPTVADLTMVELLGETPILSQEQSLVVVSRDSELEKLYHKVRAQYPSEVQYPVVKVLQTDETDTIGDSVNSLLEGKENEQKHQEVLQNLWTKSLILIPLVARGQRIGVLGVGSSQRVFDPLDLELFEELGRLAALAIDNARLYQEARNAIRVRDEFLAIASHELKTPLTPVRLAIESLLRISQKEEKIHRDKLGSKLKIADQQIERLRRLIEELLDISKITAGRMELEAELINASSLLSDLVDRFSASLQRANCKLIINAPDKVSGVWDRLRLEQILSNLLSNAMKYGAGHPVEITLKNTDETAVFCVRDHGIGIAQKDQERIFHKFERAVSERNYGGLGLGLWITRQIVEAMGGTITVSSAPNEGSTFSIELPCHPNTSSAVSEKNLPNTLPS